jgi:P-type conjugative transfer protein TrbJ
MKTFACSCILAALAVCALPARAQFVVIDPANLLQNTFTAARTLTEIENQVRQLENEAQMLFNEALNLKHLDLNTLNRLLQIVATTQNLLNQAQGMTFQLAQAQANFARLYPNAYPDGATSAQLSADSLERWSNSRFALNTAIQVQAQSSQNFAADQTVLSNLIAASQGADGILQAAQATNQLLALQARQSIQSQQLEMAQGRAASLELARGVAAEARSRTLRTQFMQGTAYTPTPINLFP